MYPWIDLYFFKIPSFGLMVATAFLVCNHLLKKEFPKHNLNPKIADDIIFYSIISAIIGSKLYHVIETGSFSDLFTNLKNILISLFSFEFSNAINQLQFLGSGLVFNGGFICALIFIAIYLRKNKINFLQILDIVCPYILLGHGIGRIGCFLVGDDYGIPTNSFLGIAFPNGLPKTLISTFTENGQLYYLGYNAEQLKEFLVPGSAEIIKVHPTQIYEMTLYFLGFFLIRKVFNTTKLSLGLTSSIYLVYAGLSRFLVELIRTNERYMFNLSSAQYISLLLIFTGIIIYMNLNKINKSYGNY
tara:strand:+ start:5364 stop:6269 length:906 start_codon:yes stop_codon:yes gene_type:complete